MSFLSYFFVQREAYDKPCKKNERRRYENENGMTNVEISYLFLLLLNMENM